jgi:hypothetical protein
LYGFAVASSSGFGSTIMLEGNIRYCKGTWDSDTEEKKSSNFREFEKVIAAAGHLRNALIFLCTNNSTVEAALVKGNLSSKNYLN